MCPLPDSDSGSTYGALGKVNYSQVPPANPLTDWSNPQLAPAITNVAGMTLVTPRVLVQFTLAATTGALVLNEWFAVWSNVTTTAPVLVRTGTGVFTVTLPTVVSDEYNASIGITNNHSVNLLMGWANLEAATAVYSASVSCVANVITIKTFNTSGANDFVGLVLDVFAR